jgi:hypothetical protein
VLLAAFTRLDDNTAVALATKVAQSGAEFAVTGDGLLTYYARAEGNLAEAERHFRAWMKKMPAWPASTAAPVIAAFNSRTAIQSAVIAINKARLKDPSLGVVPLLMIGAQDDFVDAISFEAMRGNKTRVAIYLPYLWRFVAADKGMSPRHKALMQKVGLVDYWKKHGWPDRCRPKGEDDFECS